MPTHGYTTDGRPPTVFDHILAHCFELCISAWAMLGGVAAIAAAVTTTGTVSPSLDKIPAWLAGAVGVLLVVGGGLIMRGLFDDSDNLMVGWQYERAGLILSGAGWACYGITIVSSNASAVLSYSSAATMVIASTLRFIATVRSEKRVRRALR